jgi:hypothetical protein
MEDMTWDKFYNAIVHDGRSSVRDFVAANRGKVIEYDNSEESIEGIPVVSLSASKADMNEEKWYRANKGYSQRLSNG